MSEVQAQKDKEQIMQVFERMYEELRDWREKYPEASIDEIAAQVTVRRRALMGKLLGQLACQHGKGEAVAGQLCPDCGQVMISKGTAGRGVAHLEGEMELERAYYYCAPCEAGLFPPG